MRQQQNIPRNIEQAAFLNVWDTTVALQTLKLKEGWSIDLDGRQLGQVDGVAVPAGYIGERLAPATETFSSAAFPINETATTLKSLSITAGIWLVFGFATAPLGTLSGHTKAGLGISTTTNDLTSTNVREGYIELAEPPNADADLHLHVFRYLNIAATATYYLVGIQKASSGSTTWTDTHGRSIYAVRIA